MFGEWEEEDNLKISSTPNLVLSCDEADGMALEGQYCCTNHLFSLYSKCAIALHSTEEIQHFRQQTGSLNLFASCAFLSLIKMIPVS